MDDIIKLLQELMTRGPKPKGGIASTQEGIEFLGKQLTKEQRGSLMIVNSRLTDASRFEPFSIGNVGKDKRFKLISDYEKDLSNEFNKTIEFLKANPDIRLTQAQKDNIYYNLGVLRRITNEKNKLEKGIIEDGKKPSNVLDMEGNVLDPKKPIMGGTQPKEDLIKAGKGKFTKAEYLIQRLKNTIKENPDDAYVQENFPNFIKELEANPDLAKNENVFKELGGDLPENQKIKVYDDDTLDLLTLKPTKSFRLNVDKFKEDFNVSDEELQKILALSPEEQQKVLQDYIDKDFRERIELADFDVTDKEPNAKGGRVGFSRGTPGRRMGIQSLTPHQEYYNDKIIRDNMDFIREDMRLYFDEDDRTDYQKFLDSITDKDIYGTYDERKGYDSIFAPYFETKDGRKLFFEGPGDKGIDRTGLLELLDRSKGVTPFDATKFKGGDILGFFSSEEREV